MIRHGSARSLDCLRQDSAEDCSRQSCWMHTLLLVGQSNAPFLSLVEQVLSCLVEKLLVSHLFGFIVPVPDLYSVFCGVCDDDISSQDPVVPEECSSIRSNSSYLQVVGSCRIEQALRDLTLCYLESLLDILSARFHLLGDLYHRDPLLK